MFSHRWNRFLLPCFCGMMLTVLDAGGDSIIGTNEGLSFPVFFQEDESLEVAVHFPDRSRVVADGGWRNCWNGSVAEAFHSVELPLRTEVITTCHSGSDPEEVVLTQQASVKDAAGIAGVEWVLTKIPLEYNIIIPGYSGIKMTQTTPGSRHDFEYPITWEAQMVIIEGTGAGYSVWAEDHAGRYKQLTVERTESGWRLGFITHPNAPFSGQSECISPSWHIAPYKGDWRVAAGKYRQWMWDKFHPTLVPEQHPAWVKDIRCCVIMGLDVSQLDLLAQRLDPAQTMLYLPDWRSAGYDRNYPEYNETVPELAPFISRAHDLGFRIMLHVNYFGVDPLNPNYSRFESAQVCSPWDGHERQWWLWTRTDPIIKFAYINPASKAWRSFFVERMSHLVQSTGADALHLDQTLVICNDNNGLIDGLTMLEGNIELHRDLRAALPTVALSGEGLNEITFRYESFAQRHVLGIYHSEGTFNEKYIAMAHPISSYLFRDCTILYGYLGCASPWDRQNYAAWAEAYRNWGVIPTLKSGADVLSSPEDFTRQFFDEARAWQQYRLNPDMAGDWPTTSLFPLRGENNITAVYTRDRKLCVENETIVQTLKGVSEYAGAGVIPGWRAYRDNAIIGLNPAYWYAVMSGAGAPQQLHVISLAPNYTIASLYEKPELAAIRTGNFSGIAVNLAEKMEEAICMSRPFSGASPVTMRGDFRSTDGGAFEAHGDILYIAT